MDKGGAMIASGCAKMLLLMMVAIAGASMMASCSQINMYTTSKSCSGSFIAGFDRECTEVPSGAESYKFYYNPDWRAFLYDSSGCTGNPNAVLDGDVDCAEGVDFKSVCITDGVDPSDCTVSVILE